VNGQSSHFAPLSKLLMFCLISAPFMLSIDQLKWVFFCLGPFKFPALIQRQAECLLAVRGQQTVHLPSRNLNPPLLCVSEATFFFFPFLLLDFGAEIRVFRRPVSCGIPHPRPFSVFGLGPRLGSLGILSRSAWVPPKATWLCFVQRSSFRPLGISGHFSWLSKFCWPGMSPSPARALGRPSVVCHF